MNIFLLSDFLINSATEYPDKIALYFGDDSYSYARLYRYSRNLAGFISASGFKKGDRVITYLENSPETVISMFGSLLAGGAFSVVNQTIKAHKLAYIIGNCAPKFIVTDSARVDALRELRSQVNLPPLILIDGKVEGTYDLREIINGDLEPPAMRIVDLDLAAIIYTSGSTGDPKGVALSHRNMVTAARSITQYLENVTSDIILDVLPLSFDYGLYQVLMAFLFSGTVVLEKKFGYPFKLIKLIQSRKVTGLPCVPTMMAIFLQMEGLEKKDLSSVHYISNTGAALPPSYIPRLNKIFPNARIYSMYGLTECKRVAYLPPSMIEKKPDSVGIAMPNTEVYVIDDKGEIRERDAMGELVVRGSNVMRCYWNDPEGTAKVLQPGRYPWEQVLHTGDLFRIDEDGFLYFKGRMDDIIKCRGERVSPKEIENVLYELEDLVAVRVTPVPDEIMGNAIKAEVVRKPGSNISIDEILRHCRENLEDLMLPKYIEIVESLPKSESGKILKK
ncbi:MAG: AMP-binding protein [Candidatus Zixiibacteriota bacterium]|nr:MAG: AMP-binding protein [candidate division Zixibacteria bacterium]